MAVIEGGVALGLMGVGAEAFSGGHVTIKPHSYGSLGHYAYSEISGTMAAGMAANSEILQFRWTDATRFAVLLGVTLDGATSLATGFAAGTARFRITPARAFTAAGTGGGTATLTGDNQQMRTTMGASLVGEIRIATTAALGAGTKTLDAASIGQVVVPVGTAAQAAFINPSTQLLGPPGSGFHPPVFAQNEGFALIASVPGTGTWQFGVTVLWAEVTAF